MRKWLLVCVIWLGCLQVRAQFPFYEGAGVSAAAGTWSHTYFSPGGRIIVPSMLAGSSGFNIRLQAGRPYFLKGLSAMHADLSLAVSPVSGLAFHFSRFGNQFFRETNAAVATGRKIGRRLGIGLAFGLNHHHQVYFGSQTVYSVGGNLHWTHKGTGAGIFYHSSAGLKPGSENNAVTGKDYIVGGGLGKDWSESLYGDINFYYQAGVGMAGWASMQYRFITPALIAIRVDSRPLRYSFEAGYTLKPYALMVTGGWHPVLGWTPGIAIQFRTPAKKQEHE